MKFKSATLFVPAILALAASGQASVTSWTNTFYTYNKAQWSDSYNVVTLFYDGPYDTGTPGVTSNDPWASYGYDGSGYVETSAFQSAALVSNSSSHLEVNGSLYAGDLASSQDNVTGSFYYGSVVTFDELDFSLDAPGTLNASLFGQDMGAVGPYGSGGTIFRIDGNLYAGTQSLSLGAGNHSVYVETYAQSVAGNYMYYDPTLISGYSYTDYGLYSFGFSQTGYDFDVQSTSPVPEPASLAALSISALSLLMRRRKA